MDLSTITTYQSGVAQAAAYRNLNKLFSGMLKEHGLTCMQWFVLGTIHDSGSKGIQLTMLADKLQTGLPFITNTINLLESKSMVERKASLSDSRVKSVSIHPLYKGECNKIETSLRSKMRRSVYADVSPQDLAIYVRVLYQLSKLNIKE